jgi:hypothetical protein
MEWRCGNREEVKRQRANSQDLNSTTCLLTHMEVSAISNTQYCRLGHKSTAFKLTYWTELGTLVRGISPLGGRKRRHLLRENIHQSLLRQLPLLPRKRATACTSPGKRVRSVLGPARYQVTSTPWRTCYNIIWLIWGSHSDRYGEFYLLGYNTV